MTRPDLLEAIESLRGAARLGADCDPVVLAEHFTDVAEAVASLIDPTEPDLGPDLSLIPSSREEARPVEINGMVTTAWRDARFIRYVDPGSEEGWPIDPDVITSVRSVTVLADDQVAVDAANGSASSQTSKVQAWNQIAQHPIFRERFHGEGSRVDRMTARLDRVMALVERAKDIVKYQSIGYGVPFVRDLAAVDRGEES